MVVDDKPSDVALVPSGVQQGSVLRSILILAFIKDISECIKSKFRLFAGDSIVYRTITSVTHCTALQKDLESLHEW